MTPVSTTVAAQRYLPVAGVLVFLGVGVVLRSVLHRRWYGGSGIAVVASDQPSRSWIERVAFALPVLLVLEALVACSEAGDAAFSSLAPETWRGPLAAFGFAGMLLGTAAMFIAQLDMGASWRIGIDRRENPGLVTNGLYGYSRNPIYLFMFVALGGFVLLLPGWPALLTFVATLIGIRIAVVGEEAHLAATYGDAYRAYSSRVGRFVPGLGKLTSAA
jgi:protein-S-isoprenylcysteine O-methyltransferase Ste14